MGMKHGFTLLELLLTITVILLLVALSLETYSKTKKSAEYARCKLYRQQMEIIHELPEFDYSRDYGERSPFSSVVDEMVLMYNECYRCHKVTGIPSRHAK
tara:strand:- start:306 stop:605 length:300 start_codon:yes stop_codon:yes gene_type:complete